MATCDIFSSLREAWPNGKYATAFDKVKYWKLFNLLLDDGISTELVHLLVFWFCHCSKCVSIGMVLYLIVLLLTVALVKEEFFS